MCSRLVIFQECQSLFLELIRAAKNLKEIHMHFSYLDMTPEFTFQIVQVLQSVRQQNATPLTMIIKRYNIDVKNWENNMNALQQLDIKKYLIIRENCKHEEFYEKSCNFSIMAIVKNHFHNYNNNILKYF